MLNSIFGAISFLPMVLITVLIAFTGKISILFASLVAGMVMWVLSPDFIPFSYTGMDNPIIKAGFPVMQGLANMILVLSLVVIAIATIIRYKEYEAKRLLPYFIVIALLVNFSPVFCGLIVDAGNIVMNFFINQIIGGEGTVDRLKKLDEATAITQIFTLNPIEQATTMFQRLTILINTFIFVMVFFMYFLIFILRYIAIWILVILSPLAFVCYILPYTRSYFQMWWRVFIQWIIIGIAAVFFLYLGDLFAEELFKYYKDKELNQQIGGIGAQFILPLIPSLFSIFGWIAAIKLSAVGASGVVNASQKLYRKAGGLGMATGVGATVGALRLAGNLGREASQKVGLGDPALWGKDLVRWTSNFASKTPGLKWVLPDAVRKYGYYENSVNAAKKEAGSYPNMFNARDIIEGTAMGIKGTGKLLHLAESGGLGELYAEAKRKFGDNFYDNKKFQATMLPLLRVTALSGNLSTILKEDPKLAGLVAGQKWAGDYATLDKEKAIKAATKKVPDSNFAKFIKNNLDIENSSSRIVFEGLMERRINAFRKISEEIPDGPDKVQNTIDQLFTDFVDNTLAKNKDKKMKDLANRVRKGDAGAIKDAWKEFDKHFEKEHGDKRGGFFESLEMQEENMKRLGYRQGKYVRSGGGTPGSILNLNKKNTGSP